MRHIAGIAGALSAAIFLAGPALGAISGSNHDFTAGGTGKAANQSTEICAVCHVPHQPAQNVPLWSHTLSGELYNLYNQNPEYTSPNTAAYQGSPYDFSGSMSRACLSCHDGTVAVIAAISLDSGDDTWMMWDDGSPAVAVADGLMGSHPVGLNYDTVVGGPESAEYNDPPGGAVVLEGTSPNRMVQCISCHNAHNVAAKMLVEANTGSQLCLRCHNK